MRRVRLTLFLCAAGLAVCFVFAFAHPFGNPEMLSNPGSAVAWGRKGMPPEVRAILAAKCADCHSLETRLPIYAHLAPASWLIERDVVRARAAMNLSQWDRLSSDDQQTTMRQIARVAAERRMPPPQYLALHWKARLTPDDIRAIGEWANSATATKGAITDTLVSGDAVRGKAVFEKRCTGCHALDQDREGPRLRSVYGRAAGTVKGFDYSGALLKSHVVWDESTLARWLADPDSVAPGNNMDFFVARPGERADVIQFLKEQSGK